MSKLSKKDIEKIAKLSRLDLKESEIENFQKEISSILNYVEQLSDVDTEGLSPTYQVSGLTSITRDDVVVPYKITQEQLFKNVPKIRDGHIEVKRMIT